MPCDVWRMVARVVLVHRDERLQAFSLPFVRGEKVAVVHVENSKEAVFGDGHGCRFLIATPDAGARALRGCRARLGRRRCGRDGLRRLAG